MLPADHRECIPAECIHRAALDTATQAGEVAEDIARGRQQKEQYRMKHPEEFPDQESQYYHNKRAARTADMRPKSPLGIPDNVDGATRFGMQVTEDVNVAANEGYINMTPEQHRRWRVQMLEGELLEARADMARHGDPMPLQDLRNVVGDALRLAEVKNESYGNAWQKNGYMGNLARLKSKMDRIDNMLWRDPDGPGYPLPANYTRDGETIMDSLLDLINLAGFMAINWTNENRWGE